jgi:hypothetical protein
MYSALEASSAVQWWAERYYSLIKKLFFWFLLGRFMEHFKLNVQMESIKTECSLSVGVASNSPTLITYTREYTLPGTLLHQAGRWSPSRDHGSLVGKIP